ncbi:MAG TPA: hypothetical protein VMR31_16410 [Myxococcota bacterium]|nr:hypothetical protein [Myxococcota bacterium]
MGRSAHRTAALAAALALAAAGARAGTVFTDPYGQGAPDVVGDPADFDIHSLEVSLTRDELDIEIRTNFHGGDTTLAAFTVPGTSYASVPVSIGDLLLAGKSSLWAIPLVAAGGVGGIGGGIYYAVMGPVATGEPITRGMGSVLPGSMYEVTGTATAGEVLGVGAAPDLRADVPVWGAGNIGVYGPDYIGSLPVVTSLGGPELDIQLAIPIDAAFYADVAGGYRVHFASGTCACDVIDGAVPEPGAGVLAAGALAAALLARRMNRFTAR